MQIDRREEPYVSEADCDRYTTEILPRYAEKKAALLPILHDVQERHGWLPYQALMEIAGFLGISAAEVLDTASFYDEFRLRPMGRYIIGICQSIACEVCGHERILEHMTRKLGIDVGETTEDGLFTVRAMECLGACDTAPCALLNTHRHDCLTIEAIDAMIEECRREAAAEDAAGR